MEEQQVVTDMTNREVVINKRPVRIVSLVPSQTELLYDLGLDEEVVGITKFCVHPEAWFRSKTRVGGTKQVHYDRIAELQPDLILANKEENTQEIVDTLAKDYPVWVSDIQTLQDAVQMMLRIGEMTGTHEKAWELVSNITRDFVNFNIKVLEASVSKFLSGNMEQVSVAYFIWRDPWMTVGNDTFIHNMLASLNWKNVFEDKTRYPEVTLAELAERNPSKVLLSSEPFPFKEEHIAEIKAVLPNAEVLLVDGEMFSWYGSRILKAPAYFTTLL